MVLAHDNLNFPDKKSFHAQFERKWGFAGIDLIPCPEISADVQRASFLPAPVDISTHRDISHVTTI
jgi:hypothetical protein